MKLKDLQETPLEIHSAHKKEIGIKHMSIIEKKFNDIIIKKIGYKITTIKSLDLIKTEDAYILVDNKTDELYYGLTYTKKDNGINIEWMQNYSTIKKLTPMIFVNILKKDKKVKVIYSGNIHTPENKKLHKDLNKFKQLEVSIWDDRKKMETDENPYDGLFANTKLFKFVLESESSEYQENFDYGYLNDINITSTETLLEAIDTICDLYYWKD